MAATAKIRSLNIVGAGNVGQTLGRLWTINQTFEIQDVLCRSDQSARRAVSFIGAGRAVHDIADMRSADIVLISTPDDQVVPGCAQLAAAGLLDANRIVFHCSGALRSSALSAAVQVGAAVAGIHPVRSFAAPAQLVTSFAGTCCGMEGDQRALDVLGPGFTAIGAQLVPIDADFKMLYHAAAVFASNYLVTLLDVAMQAYGKAGVPYDIALKMMEPLVRNTVDNVFQTGPEKALSGPIARGDLATVTNQYNAVRAWDQRYGALYKQLGRSTGILAARRGGSKH
jgi:predicted short-subunit dehydrogenase-like oxidoreductase (DUF2520 family)